MNIVRLGPEYFPLTNKGKPVSNGSIYIGLPDLDPEITGNQIVVNALQENGSLVVLSQPISTGAGGVPLYNGSSVTLLVDGDYSLKVLDSLGAQIYYVPRTFVTVDDQTYLSSYGGSFPNAVAGIGSTQTTLIVDTDPLTLQANLTVPSNIDIEWRSPYKLSDDFNNASIEFLGRIYAGQYQILDWGNGNGTVEFSEGEEYYVEWFGAIGDGSDDTIPIQLCFDFLKSNQSLFFVGGKTYRTTAQIDWNPSTAITNAYVGSNNKDRFIIKNQTQTIGRIINIEPSATIEYSRFFGWEFYVDDLTGTILYLAGRNILNNKWNNFRIVGGDATKNGTTKTQAMCITYTNPTDNVNFLNSFKDFDFWECKWACSIGYDQIAASAPTNIVTNCYFQNTKTYYIGTGGAGAGIYFGNAGNNQIHVYDAYTGRSGGAAADIYISSDAVNTEVRAAVLNSASDYGIVIENGAVGTDIQFHTVGGYTSGDLNDGNASDDTYLDGQTIERLNRFDKWNISARIFSTMASRTSVVFGQTPASGPGMTYSQTNGFGMQHHQWTGIFAANQTAQGINGALNVPVEFKTTLVSENIRDTLGEWNNTLFRFEPNYDGIYLVSFKLDFANVSGKTYEVQVSKTGAVYTQATISPSTTLNGATFIMPTFEVFLDTSDWLQVKFNNFDATPNSITINASSAANFRNWLSIRRSTISST